MKTAYKFGIAAAAALTIAAWPEGGHAPANHLPSSVPSIERSSEVCPPYGLSSIKPEHGRYAGHVLLLVPQCRGNNETVELIGPDGKLDGTAQTGQELAVDCRVKGGALAISAVLQRHGNVEAFEGHEPTVALGPIAQTQIGQDGVLGRHSGHHVPAC